MDTQEFAALLSIFHATLEIPQLRPINQKVLAALMAFQAQMNGPQAVPAEPVEPEPAPANIEDTYHGRRL